MGKYLVRGRNRNTMDLRGEKNGLTSLDHGEAKAVSTLIALGYPSLESLAHSCLDLPRPEYSTMAGILHDDQYLACRHDAWPCVGSRGRRRERGQSDGSKGLTSPSPKDA